MRTKLLGIAAASAAVAFAVSVPVTAANASPTPSPAPLVASDHHHGHDDDYSRRWGTYWSSNFLAKARGHISVDYDGPHSNKVHITGKLWDRDFRPSFRGGKCAYITFRFQYLDDDHWGGSKWYKYCGAGGSKSFSFWRYDVHTVRAKVCQIRPHSSQPVKCGHWRELYHA